ncbi:histidine triad nucleotide binding protein [Gordonia phage TillyBobJoe]|uniref:Histidine triad nucleotide binding protein n=1 Tax=Gordonia phage TillyBobJoe TaxID=2301560 RepID=A0A385DS77_9CAUD|nr:histidine triad nucleotide binding protein [Gordonia phage TillyBobJoe]AXQ62303.1 histidine triad nucleotide binding protein [Gordonia phage TillyBobJoe]
MRNTPNPCPFCAKIEDGTAEYVPVYNAVHFVPLNPVTEGHRLFVPDWHARHPNATATSEAMGAAVRWAASHLPDDAEYNLITSNGAAATQTVEHLHVHLVPRRPGDGLLLPWGGPR